MWIKMYVKNKYISMPLFRYSADMLNVFTTENYSPYEYQDISSECIEREAKLVSACSGVSVLGVWGIRSSDSRILVCHVTVWVSNEIRIMNARLSMKARGKEQVEAAPFFFFPLISFELLRIWIIISIKLVEEPANPWKIACK